MKMSEAYPILNLIIPCYNEEEVLLLTKQELDKKMSSLMKMGIISSDSKVIFVNDGSTDGTWDIITRIHNEDDMYVGIDLSRNKGHQNALLAGLMYAREHCDISVSMDADLQDDINVVDDMIKKYNEGSDIVYGVRSSRKKDTFLKRTTAEGFYKLMHLMGVDIVFNHADCRLMSRRALEALSGYKEMNLFLRGIVPQLGYKSAVSYYERNERAAGTSKYPLKKMLSFAIEGITSFSVKPLRLIASLGAVVLALSIIALIISLISNTSILVVVSTIGIIGGVQILCLGIIGEYIGKIYAETKQRPRYFIREILK